jgi:hypothetical protein
LPILVSPADAGRPRRRLRREREPRACARSPRRNRGDGSSASVSAGAMAASYGQPSSRHTVVASAGSHASDNAYGSSMAPRASRSRSPARHRQHVSSPDHSEQERGLRLLPHSGRLARGRGRRGSRRHDRRDSEALRWPSIGVAPNRLPVRLGEEQAGVRGRDARQHLAGWGLGRLRAERGGLQRVCTTRRSPMPSTGWSVSAGRVR